MIKRVIIVSAMVFSSTALAGDYMSADEVKTLMSGMTFDGIFLPKDKHFSAYAEPNGTHHVLRPNGKRDKGRTWFVNEKGQHCTTNPKWKKKWPNGRCSFVLNAGNGEYHKFGDNGNHTHTLSNFRSGNQL